MSDAAALCQQGRPCSNVSQKKSYRDHKMEGYGSNVSWFKYFVLLFLLETTLADRTRLYVKLHKVQVDVERFDGRSRLCAGCRSLGFRRRDCPSDYENIGSCSSRCLNGRSQRQCFPIIPITAECDMLDSQGSVSREWSWNIDNIRTDKEWLTTDRSFQFDGVIRPLRPGSSITCKITDGRNGVLAVDVNTCRSTFDDLNSGSEIVCTGQYGAYSLTIFGFRWNDNDPWSGCSSDCRQTRTIKCSPTEFSNDFDYRGYCFASTKPEDWRPCDTGQCTSIFSWVAEWGECNVECGSGTQSARSTTCTSNEGNAVDDRFCENSSRPTSQSCFAGSCPPSPSPLPTPTPSPSPVPSPTPSPSLVQSPSSSAFVSPRVSTLAWLFILSLMMGIQDSLPTYG